MDNSYSKALVSSSCTCPQEGMATDKLLQRQVAAYLEIDTQMFSKIECGDRRAKRSQVTKLAEYFHLDEKELLTLWLADRILDAIEGEDELQLHAIEVAKCELTK